MTVSSELRLRRYHASQEIAGLLMEEMLSDSMAEREIARIVNLYIV